MFLIPFVRQLIHQGTDADTDANNQQSTAHLLDSGIVGIRTPISTPNSTTMTTATTNASSSSSSFNHSRASSSSFSSSSSSAQQPPPQHHIPTKTFHTGQGQGLGQGQSGGGQLSSMDISSFSLTSMLPSSSRPLINKRLLYHHNNNNNNNHHKPHPYPLLPSTGTSNQEQGQGGSTTSTSNSGSSSGVRGIAVRGSLGGGIMATNASSRTSLSHSHNPLSHTATNILFTHHITHLFVYPFYPP